MKTIQRLKRHKRSKDKLLGSAKRPRVSIYKSNKYIYAQIIDDESGKTLGSFNQAQLKDNKGSKVEKSKLVGENLAEIALKLKINEVTFDRSGYRYHGRVKAVAEGLREKGLKV